MLEIGIGDIPGGVHLIKNTGDLEVLISLFLLIFNFSSLFIIIFDFSL